MNRGGSCKSHDCSVFMIEQKISSKFFWRASDEEQSLSNVELATHPE